jgi:orotate phosphoribosyltransferase
VKNIFSILEKSGALLNGHFILTSGKHSAQYMQCAKISQYPEYAKEICAELAKNFNKDKFNKDKLEKKIDCVVGPAVGGIILAYELAAQLGSRALFTEREDGVMTLRRGFEIEKGEKVVIAEDVITTGGSVFEVIDAVKKAGAEVLGVCVIVDRTSGVDFGAPLYSCAKIEIESYEPEECPLCKSGELKAVKPGSRSLK